MVRGADVGTNKIVWWGMGILATLVTTMAIVLMTGALTKISDHADRLTKLEVKVDAIEKDVADQKNKVDRLRNPRQWEMQRPQPAPEPGRR